MLDSVHFSALRHSFTGVGFFEPTSFGQRLLAFENHHLGPAWKESLN